MAPLTLDIYLGLFALTCAILAVTSYTDVRTRTINSFIFIPVVALGALFQSMTGAPLYYIVIGILLYLFTYLETDLVIYPVIGIAFLASSLYFIATGGIFYGFTIAIMSLVFLIGFQEKLFGIGDVKAMIALFFAFTEFPFLTSLTQSQVHLVSIMPLSIIMLFNIAIVSLFFVPYLIALSRKRGDSLGLMSVTSLQYDEKTYMENQAKFSLRETDSGKRMMYKTPFMVSVAIGFVVTMLTGAWFAFI